MKVKIKDIPTDDMEDICDNKKNVCATCIFFAKKTAGCYYFKKRRYFRYTGEQLEELIKLGEKVVEIPSKF